MSNQTRTEAPWWQTAVVYQIYPRSFCDTTGNGVGDLEGIRRHLDHLEWLGVDAIWLSPIFPSPMADHGYDVADYCNIDPLFGDLDTFDRLLGEAHDRGLKVLLDWVPNHTSDQHPWFVESRSSTDNPKRDWYLWVDGEPDIPPTGWQAMFPEGPAWEWDETTAAWYLHLFTPEQPDLNWDNPDVREAMHDTLRFWLDRGVDGFRMDVIHMIGKEPLAAEPLAAAKTHAHLREIRTVLDDYDGDRVSIGEVFLFDTFDVASYLGDGDELHLAFNFPPLHTAWSAPKWRQQIEIAERAFGERDGWPTWVIGNHDIPRPRTRYGSEAAARAAAMTVLTLRGTPFLYAGDELGLEDADVPPELVQDPAGFRDGCRAPMPWTMDQPHGWATPDTWLPFPPDVGARNAEAEQADPSSFVHLVRRTLAARRASPALQLGDLELLDTPEGVVGWRRRLGADERTVLVNFTSGAVVAPGFEGHVVEVASDGEGEAARFAGALGAQRAVLLRPEAGLES